MAAATYAIASLLSLFGVRWVRGPRRLIAVRTTDGGNLSLSHEREPNYWCNLPPV